MKELKFRAWNKNMKRMFYTYEAGVTDGSTDLLEINMPQGFILMQYTGLEDKNGKEIYEGDIVKGSCEVRYGNWDNGFAHEDTDAGIGFYLRKIGANVDKYGYSQLDAGMYPFDNFEVIGNIYENPELLTE